jgi:hypothetical protein
MRGFTRAQARGAAVLLGLVLLVTLWRLLSLG